MNNKRRHHNPNHNHNPNHKNRPRQRFQTERPSINKVYDSNGPAGRQRGTASTLYEKYVTLARDAHSSGDRVLSENLMQHAEHYLRIVNSIQEQMQTAYRDNFSESQGENSGDNASGEQNSHDTSYEETTPDTLEQEISETILQTQNRHARSEYQNNQHHTEKSDSPEASLDKPILRRKSFPFARRRSYENNTPPSQEQQASEYRRPEPSAPTENMQTSSPVFSELHEPSEAKPLVKRVTRSRAATQTLRTKPESPEKTDEPS